MSRMQEARTSRKLTQGHVAKLLKEVEPRLDTPLVSKYEAGICLPTKRQIEKLESIYGLDRTEMYAVEDLDLLEIGPKLTAPENALTGGRPKDKRAREFFRKCFRISREHEARLPDDLLSVCGFASWQSWFDWAIRMLEAQYAENVRKSRAS